MHQSLFTSIKKWWFTLVELIISLSISALVLIVIFYFVTDTVVQLADTNKNSKFLWDFSRFTSRINSHMSTFPDATILVDESLWVWHDVLLLQNPTANGGIIWGVVDTDTYKLLENSQYWKYKNTVMWYRLVSPSEIIDITTTPSNIYQYTFFGDKTFSDFKVKDFQIEYYNTGSIISIDLSIATTFETELVGEDWIVLPKDNLFEVNLNF